jgi:hypothetical protein
MSTDLFPPVLKLVMDIASVLLLGLTFAFQSVSVLVALDVVFVAMYQFACTQLSKVFSILVFFTPNERERSATIAGFFKFYSNVMWVRVAYRNINTDCWKFMYWAPMLAVAVMQALVAFYTERLVTDQRMINQAMYSVVLFSLFLMVFNLITSAPDYILMETVLLLRSTIDALCSSADTILRLCDTTAALDSASPIYMTQIARYSFWASVHMIWLIINWTQPADRAITVAMHRADRFLYFMLFMHDLLDLVVPLRQLMRQVVHERYVAKTFPRLSASELGAVAAETCPVCLSEHNAHTVRLRCNHLLHTQCLQRILQQAADTQNPAACRCPMCRAAIEVPNHPRSGQRGLFGTGTRGNATATGPVTIPFFGALLAPGGIQLARDANGRIGRTEQLIAEQLQQYELQHGDVINIRILSRRARAPTPHPTALAPVTAIGAATAGTNAQATAPELQQSALQGIHGNTLTSAASSAVSLPALFGRTSSTASSASLATASSRQIGEGAMRVHLRRGRGLTAQSLSSLVESARSGSTLNSSSASSGSIAASQPIAAEGTLSTVVVAGETVTQEATTAMDVVTPEDDGPQPEGRKRGRESPSVEEDASSDGSSCDSPASSASVASIAHSTHSTHSTRSAESSGTTSAYALTGDAVLEVPAGSAGYTQCAAQDDESWGEDRSDSTDGGSAYNGPAARSVPHTGMDALGVEAAQADNIVGYKRRWAAHVGSVDNTIDDPTGVGSPDGAHSGPGGGSHIKQEEGECGEAGSATKRSKIAPHTATATDVAGTAPQ